MHSIKSRFAVAVFLTVAVFAFAQSGSEPPPGYKWWIRMIPKKLPTGALSYEVDDLRVESKARPIVTRRADGIWEITFASAPAPRI